MRPFSTERRSGTPCPRTGNRAARSLSGVTLAIAAAATTASWQPAHAGVDENWAGPMISQMLSEQAQEPGQHRRHRGPGEEADSGDDGVRPQRRTPLKQKSANLGRDAAPLQLRPLSVIEWARPKFEAVILPKEVAPPPNEVGPMVASLGREFVVPTPSAVPELTGEPIRWLPKASVECLATPLRGVLTELAAAFGPITVRW